MSAPPVAAIVTMAAPATDRKNRTRENPFVTGASLASF